MLVGAAVSTDKGMVVTDVASPDTVAESGGVTDVVEGAEGASGWLGEEDGVKKVGTTTVEMVVSAEVVVLGMLAELSLKDFGMSLGSNGDVTVKVGCTSIPSAESEPVGPRALGHTAVVPSDIKNMPIKVSGYALLPRQAWWMVVVRSSRKLIQPLEHGWPGAKSKAVQAVSGVL